MIEEVYTEAEEKMKKSTEILRRELATVRTGRASLALLEGIRVEYYGTQVPINQVANITIPEPRLIVIQPWDKSTAGAIEKALLRSNLGLTPLNDGKVIRVPIPPLTEERRKELAKMVRKKAEEGRVAIRVVRHEAIKDLKNFEKEGEISEDDSKRAQERIQKLTDKYIEVIDQILAAKEKEILEF